MFGESFTGDEGFTFDNYTKMFSQTEGRMFSQTDTWKLLGNSLSIAFFTSLFACSIGVPLAFLVGRTDIPGKTFFLCLLLIPLVIPTYVCALSWIHLLGEQGVISLLFKRIFSLNEAPFNIYGMGGTISVLTLSFYPFVTLLTLSGLYSLDNRLEEAALLSRKTWGVIRGISFPLVAPYVAAGAFFVFILSLCNYGVPDLLRVKTYPVEVFVQFSAFFNSKAAAALSVPLVAAGLMIIWLLIRIMQGRSYVTLRSGSKTTIPFNLGSYKIHAVSFVFIILFFSVVLPLGDLIATAGSYQSYLKAWESAHSQIIFSLGIALLSATLIVVISFPLAYVIERSSRKWKRMIDFLTMIPIAVPGTVLGIGLIRVWNQPWLNCVYGTAGILLIGLTVRFLPFTLRVVSSSMKQVHPHLEEAALQTSGSFLHRIRYVMAPLVKPGMLAGWYIAFVLILGELGTSLLVVPPGSATLTMRIYTLLHYGAGKLVAALCIILILIALAPTPLLFLMGRKKHV